MDWKDSSATLKEVLKLEQHPIAVTYSMVPADGGKDGHHWVCRALQDAAGGSIINLTKDNSACHGGTWHLGLGLKPTGEIDRALEKFLAGSGLHARGHSDTVEELHHCAAAARRTPPLPHLLLDCTFVHKEAGREGKRAHPAA
jgi:uncharacterized protein (DUF169 family)